jgi:ATP-dependent helicase/nuclease subunit B
LPTLIEALAQGRLIPGFGTTEDPLWLSRATIYLPTRRACSLARELFLDGFTKDAGVLPRLRALGDLDEDALAFAEASIVGASLGLPPSIESTERRLLLARLVQQWASATHLHGGTPLFAHSPAASLALADDLARLMDDMTTRQVDWERLDDLVPECFDTYWQLSLGFLKIARQVWPSILKERGCIEAAARRDRLIAAEQARLAHITAPLIAAGSTGSMPATAALIAAIAKHPHGAVVLPGLDVDLDAASWEAIGGEHEGGEPMPGHPQFALHGLLARISSSREAVSVLSPPRNNGRGLLLSEAFRPAATTEHWKHRLKDAVIEAGLTGLAVIEAANPEEEALAIAVALREAIEPDCGAVEPDRAKAALVTADPDLARRVAAALGRWNVVAEETRGIALDRTPAGVFARLVAEVALRQAGPVALLALIKHPLFRLGLHRAGHHRAMATLERAILRGPPPGKGTFGLCQALATFRAQRAKLHPNDPRSSLTERELEAAARFLTDLKAALERFETLPPRPTGLAAMTRAHREAIAALGREPTGGVPTFAGKEGSALLRQFEDLGARTPDADLAVTPYDYPDLFHAVIADEVVPATGVSHSRIRILGPLESRLQSFDTVVLGGLIEGSWPPEARNDPWLSRPMRRELGLDLPERRIGLSAHDFAQALGAPKVVLARPAKLGGAPTVASRFLRRLAVVAGPAHWDRALARGDYYLALARQLDQSPPTPRLAAPQPRPPREARPTYATVTDVEHWLRDPYTIYAKHVLKLQPLDHVNTPPGARDRGNVIHGAVGAFTQECGARWPTDPLGELLQTGRQYFSALEAYPEARAFWWPRFLRIARWFIAWHGARRGNVVQTLAEIRGEIRIPLGTRTFRLAARADRIDKLANGRYAIIDYKTGEARSEKQVRVGLAPQLTLEAAILRHGGFENVPQGACVEHLLYVTLRGGDPAGEERPIVFTEGTPDTQADRALARFVELVRRFENVSQPFRSLVHPMWKARYGDYDHLARVKEWSATGAAPETD